MSLTPFHLAFPIHDIEETRAFYANTLGAKTGREADTWIDFDLFGHQISAHVRKPDPKKSMGNDTQGAVDGDVVPIPHFGVVLAITDWKALAERLSANPSTDWILEPKIRFEGEPGEQATLFIRDPSGNALEFKGFADMKSVFAS